jgi:hypothetical protein
MDPEVLIPALEQGAPEAHQSSLLSSVVSDGASAAFFFFFGVVCVGMFNCPASARGLRKAGRHLWQ